MEGSNMDSWSDTLLIPCVVSQTPFLYLQPSFTSHQVMPALDLPNMVLIFTYIVFGTSFHVLHSNNNVIQAYCSHHIFSSTNSLKATTHKKDSRQHPKIGWGKQKNRLDASKTPTPRFHPPCTLFNTHGHTTKLFHIIKELKDMN